MASLDQNLAALVQAMGSLPGGPLAVHDPSAPSAEMQAHRLAAREKMRAMANWDPSYPSEKTNFYEDFVHRHAPISVSWLQPARNGPGEDGVPREATGMGILYDDAGDMVDKVVAPLDDGSIGIWDFSPRDEAGSSGKRGAMIDRSAKGLLTSKTSDPTQGLSLAESKAIMTETGAVECVSIDSRQKKGFFAVRNTLNEVDLYTLQLVSRQEYPFPITALSEAKHPTPLTIGTNMTLHLHDPRRRQTHVGYNPPVRCELLNAPKNDFHRLLTGDLGPSHAVLSQPGPLSILHMPSREWDGNGSIWVAGRFTSLLNYDRRFFPRLRGTIHSGARLSCLTSLPFPFIPREKDLMRDLSLSLADVRAAKAIPGTTLIAAGEYKGKGSLELYGLSSSAGHTTLSTDSVTAQRNAGNAFRNRQTASASKLLAAAPHGTRIVYADGDGNLKWVERDGFTPVRRWNVNPDAPAELTGDIGSLFFSPSLGRGEGDIVQKIVPTTVVNAQTESRRLGEDNLLIWTGDGRVGVVGFGHEPLWRGEEFEEAAEREREEVKGREERAYGRMMRRALERQAHEARWIRGLGLGR